MTINFPVVDLVDDVVGVHAVHGAPHTRSSPQDLLHHSREVLGHGPGPHDAGRVDDVVQGDVAAVLDVLHLLPVPGRLLQRLDDEGGGGEAEGAHLGGEGGGGADFTAHGAEIHVLHLGGVELGAHSGSVGSGGC